MKVRVSGLIIIVDCGKSKREQNKQQRQKKKKKNVQIKEK